MDAVFLSFINIDGIGGWSSEGCRFVPENRSVSNNIICLCDHLTSFTILLVSHVMSFPILRILLTLITIISLVKWLL